MHGSDEVDAPHADAADAELPPHEVVERDPYDDEVAAGLHLLELDLVLGTRTPRPLRARSASPPAGRPRAAGPSTCRPRPRSGHPRGRGRRGHGPVTRLHRLALGRGDEDGDDPAHERRGSCSMRSGVATPGPSRSGKSQPAKPAPPSSPPSSSAPVSKAAVNRHSAWSRYVSPSGITASATDFRLDLELPSST